MEAGHVSSQQQPGLSSVCLRAQAQAQACSSSTRTPWQSFGCTNMTGLPCAPFDGFSDSRRTPRARRSFTALSMSST